MHENSICKFIKKIFFETGLACYAFQVSFKLAILLL